jgi:hypothetical protein
MPGADALQELFVCTTESRDVGVDWCLETMCAVPDAACEGSKGLIMLQPSQAAYMCNKLTVPVLAFVDRNTSLGAVHIHLLCTMPMWQHGITSSTAQL